MDGLDFDLATKALLIGFLDYSIYCRVFFFFLWPLVCAGVAFVSVPQPTHLRISAWSVLLQLSGPQ